MKDDLLFWFHQPEWIMKLHVNEDYEASRVNGHLYFSEMAVHDFSESYRPIVAEFIDNLKLTTDSHDNITGCLTVARIYGCEDNAKWTLHKYFFQRIRHPRDYVYWYDLSSLFMFPFHLWTLLTKYKYRDIDGDGDKEQILKTDGLKLMLLRNAWYEKKGDLFYRFIGKYITNFILKVRFGSNPRKKIMDIFFRDPSHPLRRLN